MAKLSRRELARVAGGMSAAQALRLDAQTPVKPAYIGPLTGVTTDLRDRRFDPVAYTRDLYASAPRQLRFRARNRREAEAWQKTLRSKLTELVRRLPTNSNPARRDHTRDTRISRLRAREDRVRQPTRCQRARLSPASRKSAPPGRGDDLRARPRPRRGRHRRHRRTGWRADRQGGLPARLRNPGRRSRHGRPGDRADGLRLPPRCHQRSSRPVAEGLRSGGRWRAARRSDDDRLARVGRHEDHRLHRNPL